MPAITLDITYWTRKFMRQLFRLRTEDSLFPHASREYLEVQQPTPAGTRTCRPGRNLNQAAVFAGPALAENARSRFVAFLPSLENTELDSKWLLIYKKIGINILGIS